MKRTILSAASILLATTTCLADYVVEGTVIDRQGEPLIGATVRVSGTNIAVAADSEVNIRLKVPDKASMLTCDYVGYDPLTLKAKARMGEVVLEARKTMLRDAVVT